jgi:hypothetical protein
MATETGQREQELRRETRRLLERMRQGAQLTVYARGYAACLRGPGDRHEWLLGHHSFACALLPLARLEVVERTAEYQILAYREPSGL